MTDEQWELDIELERARYAKRCREFANRSKGQKNRKRRNRTGAIMPLAMGFYR